MRTAVDGWEQGLYRQGEILTTEYMLTELLMFHKRVLENIEKFAEYQGLQQFCFKKKVS